MQKLAKIVAVIGAAVFATSTPALLVSPNLLLRIGVVLGGALVICGLLVATLIDLLKEN